MEDDNGVAAGKKPSRRNKFNARFPPNRIKKIIQVDEDIGKMTAAVPVLIGRSVELFAEKLLLKAAEITATRQAKTLAPQHLKAAVALDPMFQFLAPVVSKVPDILETPPTPGLSGAIVFSLTPSTATEVTPTGKKRGRPRLNKSESCPSGGDPVPVKRQKKRRAKNVKEKRFNDVSDDEDFDDGLLDERSNTGQSVSTPTTTNGVGGGHPSSLLSQSSSISTGVQLPLETSSDFPSSSSGSSGGTMLSSPKKFVFDFPVSHDPPQTIKWPPSHIETMEPSRLILLPATIKHLVDLPDEKS